jgi:hypothetical protein
MRDPRLERVVSQCFSIECVPFINVFSIELVPFINVLSLGLVPKEFLYKCVSLLIK